MFGRCDLEKMTKAMVDCRLDFSQCTLLDEFRSDPQEAALQPVLALVRLEAWKSTLWASKGVCWGEGAGRNLELGDLHV